MINSFFVYGTLMKGKWNDERLFNSVGQYRTSVKKGVINGRIYAVTSFPGVKLNDENSLVYGELHTFPEERMPEFLRVYDRLEGYVEGREGNIYDRRVVTSPWRAARKSRPTSTNSPAMWTKAFASSTGAWLNVRTNVAGVKDRGAIEGILAEGAALEREAAEREAAILTLVERKFAA